ARGSARAVQINPGFETKKALTMGIDIPSGLGYDAAKSGAIVRQLVDRFSTVPGVTSVARGRAPLGGGVRMTSVVLGASQEKSKDHAPVLYYSYVSPNFFQTLSIPIIHGRTFTDADAPASAYLLVVSPATAQT